jgi:RNA polymerase sigma-70 factor (ECF subfamily)
MTVSAPSPSPLASVEQASIEDELLAVRCQLGEPAAFDELFARWHLPLWKYLRRLLDSDESTSDTVQDVWVRVLRGIGRLRDTGRLRAWLFGVARRAAMDRLRVKYAEPPFADLDVGTLDLPADANGDLEGDSRALHDELSQLPFIEREILALFYLQELSLQQLSDVLAIPVGTAKSRLFRARHLLRQRLSARGVRP